MRICNFTLEDFYYKPEVEKRDLVLAMWEQQNVDWI
jgi:hypothetical protein